MHEFFRLYCNNVVISSKSFVKSLHWCCDLWISIIIIGCDIFQNSLKCAKVSKSVRKFLSIIWLWSERHNMVQMDRCKLTLDLPKFQPMKEQDSHLLTNQRPSLTLDLPRVVIAPPSDNGLVFRHRYFSDSILFTPTLII